jgi:hypothetical protein
MIGEGYSFGAFESAMQVQSNLFDTTLDNTTTSII